MPSGEKPAPHCLFSEEAYGQPGARLAGTEKPRQLKDRLGLEFLGSKPPALLSPEAA
jgi:hypothetical protein